MRQRPKYSGRMLKPEGTQEAGGRLESRLDPARLIIPYTRTAEVIPMKVVKCRDVGVDCDFVARGETVDEVLRQCGEHARSAHGYADVPPELVEKVRAAIRDEDSQTAKV